MLEAVISLTPPAALPHCPPLGGGGHFSLCSGLPVSRPAWCLASGSTGWLDEEDSVLPFFF